MNRTTLGTNTERRAISTTNVRGREQRKRILILCTGNSARSQMAEGLVRHFLGDRWEVHSAGTQPTGQVHPLAVEVMAELGIDLSSHRSKSSEEFRHQDFDLVVTVCDSAAENCPVWLGRSQVLHMGFPDPAAAEGSEEERRAVFRAIRDEIRRKLLGYLEMERTPFQVPARHNPKLRQLVERVNADVELRQLWKCANVNAVERSGISDHGEVHIRIVANAALRLLRLLVEAGIEPSVVTHHGMTPEDAEVIVELAACLHDIGISVHRDEHEHYSLILAYPKARQLLAGIYEDPELTIMVAETMHAIIAHRWEERCLTLEAGAVKVADALDMTHGRSRIPFEAGQINIHSVSALAVESVSIEKGTDRPIQVDITLSNSAGIFQIDELLKRKLRNSTLAPYVEVVAHIEGETERRLLEIYKL